MAMRLILCLLAGLLPGMAMAAGWSRYVNARFGYGVDVPPRFSAIREAENGDGGTASSPEGHASLAIFGANLLDQPFTADTASRIESASAQGWTIVYRSVTRAGATWSGTKGDRILYAHAVPRCRDQAAYLQIEYDALAKAAFDPLVARLARSLTANGTC